MHACLYLNSIIRPRQTISYPFPIASSLEPAAPPIIIREGRRECRKYGARHKKRREGIEGKARKGTGERALAEPDLLMYFWPEGIAF